VSFNLEGRIIILATGNIHKFNETRAVLSEYDIITGMLKIKTLEIQSESLEDIAKASVQEAYKKCNLPIIVEDAGLFVKKLNGFPGPYAAYVYKTIGNKGLLELMKSVENREAEFQSVIAFRSARLETPMCFSGGVLGEITKEERTANIAMGFGFDPIFKPKKNKKTFAEMTLKEKNKHSHRANALRKFGEWYRKMQQQETLA
jgi:XTP/dITP diphosphohydrolase